MTVNPEESQYVPEDTEEEIENRKIEKKQPPQKRKNNIFEYLNNDAKKNKWRSLLGNTVSPYDDTGRSSAIDSAASNYNDAKEKVPKIYVCSKQVNMTKIFPDTFLACLSLVKLHLEIEIKKLFESRKVWALGATLPMPDVKIIFTKAPYIHYEQILLEKKFR